MQEHSFDEHPRGWSLTIERSFPIMFERPFGTLPSEVPARRTSIFRRSTVSVRLTRTLSRFIVTPHEDTDPMVALQTADPDRPIRPVPVKPQLRLIESPPNERWSSAHPAVRARRGELHAVQRHAKASAPAVAEAGPVTMADSAKTASVVSQVATPPRAQMVIPGGQHAGRRAGRRWVYLRRRVVAAVVLLALMWAAVAVVAEMVDGGSSSAGASAEVRSQLVEPGDTWWSLAKDLDRSGDIRDTIAALVDLNGGEELLVGHHVLLPAA